MNADLIKSMARRIVAGKEPPVAPAQPAGQDYASQEEATPSVIPPPPEKKKPVSTRTYYFTATQAINFSGFHSKAGGVFSQGSVDMTPTLDKLRNSLSGKNTYQADYFAWQKLVVKTDIHNPGSGEFITYTCNTNNFGGKKDASIDKNVEIPGIGSRLEDIISYIEENVGILNQGTVPGGSKVINLDSSSETIYYNTTIPNDKLRFQDVASMFGTYRVWGPENRLMFPDMKDPRNVKKDGDLVGGYYAGGQAAYNALIQKLQQAGIEVPGAEEKPEEESTKQLTEKQPEKPEQQGQPGQDTFQPVDEQTDTSKVKGQVLDKTAKKSTAKRPSGDYASVPYSGGSDVVQRLFYDQAKSMKIRQAARKVAAMYLEEEDSLLKESATAEKSLQPIVKDSPSFSKDYTKIVQEIDRTNKMVKTKPGSGDDSRTLAQRANLAKKMENLYRRHGITKSELVKTDKAKDKVFPSAAPAARTTI